MMTRKRLAFTGAITALSLGLAGATIHGQNSSSTSTDDQNTKSTTPYGTQSGSHQRQGVTKLNKASKLVGMDVKNQQGESLGKIKEVVLDLDSGRISYLVLSANDSSGTDKMIAVPADVFQHTSDQNLTLNVDKQRLQSATSLSQSNWPDPSNPSWGASADLWQNMPGRSRQESFRRYSNEGNFDQDRFNQSGRSSDQNRFGTSDQDRFGTTSSRYSDQDRFGTSSRSFDQDRFSTTGGRYSDQDRYGATSRSYDQDRFNQAGRSSEPDRFSQTGRSSNDYRFNQSNSYDRDRTGRSFDQDRMMDRDRTSGTTDWDRDASTTRRYDDQESTRYRNEYPYNQNRYDYQGRSESYSTEYPRSTSTYEPGQGYRFESRTYETAPSYRSDRYSDEDRNRSYGEEMNRQYWSGSPESRARSYDNTSSSSTYSSGGYPNNARVQGEMNTGYGYSHDTTRYNAGARTYGRSFDAEGRTMMRGQITAIHPEERTMTISGPSGTQTFAFSERPMIQLKNNRNPKLVDLKVGYNVRVGFHREADGTLVAHSVIRTDTPDIK